MIYEVNLAVDRDAAGAYAAWLGPHIQEVLEIDGFESAEWWEVAPPPGAAPEASGGEGRVRWCVHYRVHSRAALQAYLDRHAARLRGNGLARFAGRFEASRRILLARGEHARGERAGA